MQNLEMIKKLLENRLVEEINIFLSQNSSIRKK